MIMSFRTNRTHLKNEFFAVGALKKGTPGAPFEDDLLLHLGVESIECITFFKRLQLPFSTHRCTREFQEETTSPLHIPREDAQAMAKLKCSFWLNKLLG